MKRCAVCYISRNAYIGASTCATVDESCDPAFLPVGHGGHFCRELSAAASLIVVLTSTPSSSACTTQGYERCRGAHPGVPHCKFTGAFCYRRPEHCRKLQQQTPAKQGKISHCVPHLLHRRPQRPTVSHAAESVGSRLQCHDWHPW